MKQSDFKRTNERKNYLKNIQTPGGGWNLNSNNNNNIWRPPTVSCFAHFSLFAHKPFNAIYSPKATIVVCWSTVQTMIEHARKQNNQQRFKQIVDTKKSRIFTFKSFFHEENKKTIQKKLIRVLTKAFKITLLHPMVYTTQWCLVLKFFFIIPMFYFSLN